MEDEDNHTAVVATNTQTSIKKGDNGACIDRQPDTVVHRAGLNQTAGRGSRSGPGAHATTGIRVLKAGHNERVYLFISPPPPPTPPLWCSRWFQQDKVLEKMSQYCVTCQGVFFSSSFFLSLHRSRWFKQGKVHENENASLYYYVTPVIFDDWYCLVDDWSVDDSHPVRECTRAI